MAGTVLVLPEVGPLGVWALGTGWTTVVVVVVVVWVGAPALEL